MTRVIVVTFPGATTLDVAGPAEVFAGVERAAGRPAYEVVIASVGGVEIETTSTLRFSSRDPADDRIRSRASQRHGIAPNGAAADHRQGARRDDRGHGLTGERLVARDTRAPVNEGPAGPLADIV